MPSHMSPTSPFLELPPEIRIKIYGFLFNALLADLPDNLFAVFSVFDNTYDTTRDLKTECAPIFPRTRCPHKPISSWLCGHHLAGWLAFEEPPHVPRKLLVFYYKFDREAVLMYMKPKFKAWVERDKELFGCILAGENPFRSGITSILLVNRTIHVEAIEILYEHVEIVINLYSSKGDDHLAERNRLEGVPSYPRFEGVQLAPFRLVRRLKLNIWLDNKEYGASDTLFQRLERLLEVLEDCSRLTLLEIFVDGSCAADSGQFSRSMQVLKMRLLPITQKRICPTLISLGKVSLEEYSSDEYAVFLEAIHGWVINFHMSHTYHM